MLVVLMMLPCYEPRAAAVALQSSALAMPQSRHGRAARAPEGALSGRSPHSSYLWVVLMQSMVNILGYGEWGGGGWGIEGFIRRWQALSHKVGVGLGAAQGRGR